MSEDHERIEELLAGYVLLSLSGDDAAEADRLLTDHVPTCVTCRRALADLGALSGDLALAAPPLPPPDLLLPRIRRGITEVPVPRRRIGASLLAVAAGVVALVAVAGLTVTFGSRATTAEAQRGRLLDAISAFGQPGANPVSLHAPSGAPQAGDMVEVTPPGAEQMHIVGRDIPPPAPGYGYQLWVGDGTSYVPVGSTFMPEAGMVVLELTIPDPAQARQVLITEEPLGASAQQPSSSIRWMAEL